VGPGGESGLQQRHIELPLTHSNTPCSLSIRNHCPLNHRQHNTMPPCRSLLSSIWGGASAAAQSGSTSTQRSASNSSHSRPPSALEQALGAFLAEGNAFQDVLLIAAAKAPTELVTAPHIQRLIVMLCELPTAAAAGGALAWLMKGSPERQKQFGSEGYGMQLQLLGGVDWR